MAWTRRRARRRKFVPARPCGFGELQIEVLATRIEKHRFAGVRQGNHGGDHARLEAHSTPTPLGETFCRTRPSPSTMAVAGLGLLGWETSERLALFSGSTMRLA